MMSRIRFVEEEYIDEVKRTFIRDINEYYFH